MGLLHNILAKDLMRLVRGSRKQINGIGLIDYPEREYTLSGVEAPEALSAKI